MVNATKHQITPLGLFIDKYYRGDKSTRARDIRIHNTLEIVVTLDALLPGQCLLIAVLCTTYPLHGNGIYTHYLNARLMGNENILLTGDLTPFGIFGFASIEVTPNILGQATNKVINARATINNVAKIAVAEKAESRQSNVTNGLFQTNACIWNGL